MRRIKFLLCMLLALSMLLPCLPGAAAEEPEQAEQTEQTDQASDEERFAGKTWDQVVEEFLQSWGTEEKKVGIGYYNTVTGEEHYVNPDQYMVSASMYKVPLNMVFLDRVSSGEMDWDTTISGYPYEQALEQTIVHSDNNIAVNMVRWVLGNGRWQEGRRALAPYCGLDPETVDYKFLENNFSTPRQMISCLRLLYENQDRFPRIIETMQRAEPTEYFKRRERRFNIAHKYGFLQEEYHLYMNDCGIAFTDEPILMVLFTDNVVHAYDVLTEFCTLMCDYAQYHHVLRLEEEAAEAERQRQEAERLEAERRAAEETAAQQAGEQGEEPTVPVPPQTGGNGDPASDPEDGSAAAPPATERAQQPGPGLGVLIPCGAALLAGLIAMIVLAAQGKKNRVRSRGFVLTALVLTLLTLGRIGWPAYQSFRDRPAGDPQETVREFFAAVVQRDYPRAYGWLDGVETLGLEYEPEGDCQRMIFETMRSEFAAELYGECTVSGDRAYQQVNCRYLDLDKLDSDARTQALTLISRYASTHSVGELYNENGNYRPELVREAWEQAATELLQQPENYRSSGGVQLELRWHDGAWHIVPNEKLLQLLSGGIALQEKEGEA